MARTEITVDGDRPDPIDQTYEIGDRVSCRMGSEHWLDGTVGAVYGRVYRVDFDDRRVAWFHPDRMRYLESRSAYGRRRKVRLALAGGVVVVGVVLVVALVVRRGSDPPFAVHQAQIENEAVPPDLPPPPIEPVEELPEKGTLVIARHPGTDTCFLARIAGETRADGTSPVQFLDGRVVALPVDHLFRDAVGPGSRVDARTDDGQWLRGTVRERNHEQVLVALDSGDQTWKTLDRIRLRCK